jgi:hypothetical protein
MQKKKNSPSQAKTKEKRLRVWIEADNVANVSAEIARNGRMIQGEVNCALRDYYASKWDAPASVTTAQGIRTHTGQWHELPLANTASRIGIILP